MFVPFTVSAARLHVDACDEHDEYSMKMRDILNPAFVPYIEYTKNKRCLKVLSGIQHTFRNNTQHEYHVTGIRLEENLQLHVEVSSRDGLDNLQKWCRDLGVPLTEEIFNMKKKLYDEPFSKLSVQMDEMSFDDLKQRFKERGKWPNIQCIQNLVLEN